MSGASPFPVKLRKTKVDSDKKPAGKFEVKLKVRDAGAVPREFK